MTKLYADTNRFIDFYQAADDKLDVFDELQAYRASLVLTEQTIVEFRRNRVSTLRWLATQLKKSIEIPAPYTTSILRSLPAHKELTELRTTYKDRGQIILEHLEHLIENEAADPVAQKFLGLAADSAVRQLPITQKSVELAQRRKLLGNPPCSSDKYSAGDEVIWEILLDGLKEDLVLVTKDRTFHDNVSLLSEEYATKTGHQLLLVTDRFSVALKRMGQQPSEKLVEVEKEEKKSSWLGELTLSPEQLHAMTENELCPSCGKRGFMYGYDSDGDSADWFECSNCGYFHGL